MNDITPIGMTNWRNQKQQFGIMEADRFGHIYSIGKTGVGKSTLLLNMAIHDIQHGRGACIIDPHGDVSETLLKYIPEERIQDVIYFNPTDADFPIAFNPLHAIHPNHHHLVASGLISMFKKVWVDSWGPRLEYILRFAILTLLEYPHATILDIQPLLTDYDFRSKVLSYCTNPHIRAFWYTEFDKYPSALKAEAISPILNKTGVFLSSIPLRNILGQRISSFRMQQVLDEGKILICNLSKGQIGEDASAILGSVLVTSIQLAALYRSSIPEQDRKPFYLYVDEMQSFVSLSFADMLAEARKYKLSLFLTHQYIDQLHEKIRSAIFGNVGTLISFRVGSADAEYLSKEFYPNFSASDLISLPKYSMYLKLMIDGATSMPFNAQTLPISSTMYPNKQRVIDESRNMYTRKKDEVEKMIFKRYGEIEQTDQTPTLFS
jgi:hypothetical protein